MSNVVCGTARITPQINRTMCHQIAAAMRHPGDEIGHELTTVAPLAGLVMRDASVRRTVCELIGPFSIDPCRHLHLNRSPKPGGWHQDDYCGKPWPRPSAIISYFPQATPPEMGVTVALDRGLTMWPNPVAGAFMVMTHDVWHCAAGNVTGRPRYMLKFVCIQEAAA